MANEITEVFSIRAEKSEQVVTHGDTVLITMAGDDMSSDMQAIGTSNEAVSFGDIAPGSIALQNLGPTNYVEIFLDNMNAQLVSKLRVGEWCKLMFPGTGGLFARANTAGITLKKVLVDL